LRGNRKIFDQLEVSQQVLGGLLLHAMQNNIPPGKVKRIIGEEPTQQFYDKEFEQYGAIIKEGVRSQTQKDAYYYELVSLKREGIVNVPESEIIRALQMSGIDELQKAVKQQDQQKAEMMKKMDEQERMNLKLEQSKIEENLALSAERRARVHSDDALAEERVSEAAENRAQAALARAKTILEISKLNETRIMEVLKFVNEMEKAEATDQEQVSAKVKSESDSINSQAREKEPEQEQMPMQGLEQ
jgi:hypothetical protein